MTEFVSDDGKKIDAVVCRAIVPGGEFSVLWRELRVICGCLIDKPSVAGSICINFNDPGVGNPCQRPGGKVHDFQFNTRQSLGLVLANLNRGEPLSGFGQQRCHNDWNCLVLKESASAGLQQSIGAQQHARLQRFHQEP